MRLILSFIGLWHCRWALYHAKRERHHMFAADRIIDEYERRARR